MKILIGGDVCPTSNNISDFSSGKIDTFLEKKLLDKWQEAGYRIFNLEVPLCENISPIKKSGPNLFCSKECINGIVQLNPNLICLANNHIMDQGIKGFKNTISLLSQNNINYVGVGNNSLELKKYYILSKDNIKIGIYNCCDTEFTSSTSTFPGANCFDSLSAFDDIKELKKMCKYTIVIFHGGKEYYRYPSPYLQKISHKLVDSGANLILYQHTHCIGCYEKYKNSNILYGQGNFIFTDKTDEFWSSGLLVELEISKEKFDVNYIPIENDGKLINLADKKIMKEFYKRSEEILKDSFVETMYKEFADSQILNYLNQCNGKTLIKRVLRKLFGTKRMFNDSDLLNIQNILQCDAHRELFLQALKNEMEK